MRKTASGAREFPIIVYLAESLREKMRDYIKKYNLNDPIVKLNIKTLVSRALHDYMQKNPVEEEVDGHN